LSGFKANCRVEFNLGGLKLIERLLSRKEFDIDLYLTNLKKVYLGSRYYADKNKTNKKL
jgi:hypothetical protein